MKPKLNLALDSTRENKIRIRFKIIATLESIWFRGSRLAYAQGVRCTPCSIFY
jgi:hypothetical protein